MQEVCKYNNEAQMEYMTETWIRHGFGHFWCIYKIIPVCLLEVCIVLSRLSVQPVILKQKHYCCASPLIQLSSTKTLSRDSLFRVSKGCEVY